MGNSMCNIFSDEEVHAVHAVEGGSNYARYRVYNCVPGRADGLWSDGKIPYDIDSSVDFNRGLIQKAMETIERYSRFRFVKRTSQIPYLFITRDYGCYFIFEDCKRPYISLGYGCGNYSTILHELLHALGFVHEHERPDRNEYVTIHWKNIKEDHKSQFEKRNHSVYRWTRFPFDEKSIMIYHSYAFSKNGKRTIETKDGREIPRNEVLSDLDIVKLRRL